MKFLILLSGALNAHALKCVLGPKSVTYDTAISPKWKMGERKESTMAQKLVDSDCASNAAKSGGPTYDWTINNMDNCNGASVPPSSTECKEAVCTKDPCSDGNGPRPIGDNCCACPEDKCEKTPCTKDLCPDKKGRRQIGDDCCACPEDKCKDQTCSPDKCGDGSQPTEINGQCCQCPQIACSCVPDACPFGGGPQTINGECCKCKCDEAQCPEDLCPDQSERREIDGKCCQCPEG